MRQNAARTLVLIATAFLAGCMAEPAAPVVQNDHPANEPTPETSAPAGPGPSDEPKPSAAEPEAKPRPTVEPGEEEDPLQPTKIPIHFNGTTPTRECIGSLRVGCREIEPGQNTSIPLDALAVPRFLNGTLTWDGATPATNRMYVYLDSKEHDGDNPFGYWGSETRKVAGKSPLQVSFDLFDYRGETEFVLLVDNFMACLFPDGPALNCAFYGSFGYSVAQDFSFEGELTGWD